jgi:hypothetical protein
MSKMKAKEFVDKGFLQEVNRLFFHPHGLALAIELPEEGPTDETTVQAYVIDGRDDPAGIWFDINHLSTDKAKSVLAHRDRRRDARLGRLGFGIQPLTRRPPPTDKARRADNAEIQALLQGKCPIHGTRLVERSQVLDKNEKPTGRWRHVCTEPDCQTKLTLTRPQMLRRQQ